VLSDSASAAKPTEVTICHRESNPPNEQTITVGVAAAAHHILHHPDDDVGACIGGVSDRDMCIADCFFQNTEVCFVGDKKCQAENLSSALKCIARNC